MKEKAESWSRKSEVKKRARTTEFHWCMPSTASCSAPSGPRSASCGPKSATSIDTYTVCSAQPSVIESSERKTVSSSAVDDPSWKLVLRSSR